MARVLVIEDNRDNLRLMETLLRHYGHETLAAMSGEEGIARVRDDSPDLVLLDIQMPVMDGIEACARIRELPGGDTVPIVAVTALAMVGDEDRIRSSGFDGYLTKPIDPRRFGDQIAPYLA
jgi:two-component system cell cycle response regulator